MKKSDGNAPVYIVIGAGGGIGTATCRKLSARGARLVVAGRRLETLEPLATDLGARSFVVDASDADQVGACFFKILDEFGDINGAVNCVGSLLLKPADRTSQTEWNDIVATNLGSAFAAVRAAAKTMTNGGSVVLLASAASEVGLVNHDALAAAKAGVSGLAPSAAATYASRGLRFNCVAPGMVRTSLTRSMTENELTLKGAEAMHPLGRIGTADEIASAIAFFLSSDQSWVTGEVLSVDGGLAHARPRIRV